MLHLDGFPLQGFELHLAVCGQQLPVLLLDLATLQSLYCTLGPVYKLWPELHMDVSTLQSPVLHIDMSSSQEPELHLDLSTPQG